MIRPRLRGVLGLLLAAAPLALAQAQPTLPVAEEFNALHFRSIGPATMSGRIADIAVYEANPAVWFVATAHGGVWKTTSNGATWTPILQDQGLMSFGDVTVSQQNPNLVWAGGGESNNRQSTSWGNGVWKSTDGGETWTHMGLKDSKHIHRIVIDPRNNDVVLVAATGALFGPGGERGVYKTTDGGRSWRRVLAGDEDTGANDLTQSASNPNVLFASMYQRRRSECCMNGGGPGSALYRSTDGGDTWSKVGGGFPTGDLGRIAVDVSRTNGNIVYALVEAPPPARTGRAAGGDEEGETPMAQRAGSSAGDTGLWRSNDGGNTWTKVNGVNPRPMYFSKVLVDPTNPETVYYGGVGLHMSIDGGKNMETDAALATHDDIHALWVNPRNPQHIIIGNDGGVATSYDQAKSWTFIPNLPVGLFYHVAYDMSVPFNICGGMQDNYNWCGPSRSRFGRGIQNYDWFQILGGDGFHAIPDLRDPRIVYTESQNGNMLRRNIVTGEAVRIRPTPQNVTPKPDSGESFRFQWDAPMMLSPHDPGVLYVAANRVFRSTDRGDSWQMISPDLTTNADRDTIAVMGVPSRDVRLARNDGISSWPALTTLAESPAQAGVLWTGSDDGVVSVTRDGGRTWRNVTANIPGFPAGAYVGRVMPSKFSAGRAYVAVPNYRQNDYRGHLWVTEDFGQTFRRVSAGLDDIVVRTITEDPRNGDVLYLGTETGIVMSLDRGASWKRLKSNLPDVRVDEIAIHPRDNAMIVGSHGRAIWVLDDLAPVQEYAAAFAANRSTTLFTPTRALQWKYKDDRNDEFWGHQWFSGENPPSDAVIQYYVKLPSTELSLRIQRGNETIREIAIPEARRGLGIQTMCWDMRLAPIPAATTGDGGGGGGGFGGANRPRPIEGVRAPVPEPGYKPRDICAIEGQGGGGFGGQANAGPYATPGTYTVQLVADGRVVDSKPITIVMDPEVRFTAQQRAAYDRTAGELHEAHRAAAAVVARLQTLREQIGNIQDRIDSVPGVTDREKQAFNDVKAGYEALREKFGLPIPGVRAGGGGGGFGGFGGGSSANVYGSFVAAKAGVLNVWETPSAGTMAQIRESRAALTAALRDAERLLDQATRAGRSLQARGLTLAP